ncbi:MAG: alpha/beta hydrolase [Nitrospinae bacterium]|nr:alpha/beta hydrolase [Nitrospinota bacterium]
MVYGLILLTLALLVLLVAGHVERELYMLRWFDLANRSGETPPPWTQALFADRGRPLRAYLRETLYGILYAVTQGGDILFGWTARRRRPPFDGAAPLVVLIHGYRARPAHFWLLRWRLRRMAPNIVTFAYDGKDPLVPYHLRLRDVVLAARRNGAPARTLLIGHSYGGIIAFDYATGCAEPGEMVALAALGAPFHGSRLAALGFSPLARSMTPSNPRFGAILAARPDCPFLSLFTRYDQFVIPYTNSEHPAADHREIDTCGHAGLYFDRTAWKALRGWLAPSLAASPPPE